MVVKVKCDFPTGNNLKLATRNIQDAEGNWENRITGVSTLSRNIGEDKSYEISGMSIDLDDTDRFFRKMMSGVNQYIAAKKIQIFDENNTVIYTGNVEKWAFGENSFTLNINDRLSGLDAVLPKTATKADYHDMPSEGDGSSIPIIYGLLETPGGAVKCWKVAAKKYLLASHQCMALHGVYDSNGADISSDFSLTVEGDGASQRAYIVYGGAQDPGHDFICVNVSGKNSGGALIDHPLDALADLVASATAFSIYEETPGDWNKKKDIMTSRGYKISALLSDQISLKDFLVGFSFSFDCDFFLSRTNQLVISILDWDKMTSAKLLDEKTISSYTLNVLPEAIHNRVKYKYHFDPAGEKFLLEPEYLSMDSIAHWGEFFNKSESLELKYVKEELTALDVVQRYAFQKKNPRRSIQVDLPLEEFVGLDIADIIEISHPSAIDTDPRKYQIRRVDIDFLADAVQMECLDISTLAGDVLILGDSSMTELWSNASPVERQYAYLCDADGFLRSPDAEGKILY